jgi:magnesium transporter
MTPEQRLVEEFLAAQPADAGRTLDALATDTVVGVLDAVRDDIAATTLQHMAPTRAAACLDAVDARRAASWLARLPLAVAASLVRRLDEQRVVPLVDALPAETGTAMRVLLRYPDHTVGAVMDPQVQVAPVSATVGEVITLLHDAPAHVYYYVYVIEPTYHLAGVLDLAEALQADRLAPVSSVMKRRVVRLLVETPLPSAIAHPAWIDFDALPVVTTDDVFVGVVRHRTVRQLQLAYARERQGDRTTETLVALGELCWLGLAGLLQGLASTASSGGHGSAAAVEVHDAH